MAKIMKTAAWVSLLLTALWAALYLNMGLNLFLALAITFGTTAYHFAMRLAVGGVIDSLLHNRVDYRARWFQVSPREQKLYKALRVKAWKGKMPTYDPCSFDRKKHSWEEIAQAMCQAELVHEAIIPLSFLPLLAAVPFGEFGVFLITSVLAACFDAMFVIMQRYNRPRVLRLIRDSGKES